MNQKIDGGGLPPSWGVRKQRQPLFEAMGTEGPQGDGGRTQESGAHLTESHGLGTRVGTALLLRKDQALVAHRYNHRLFLIKFRTQDGFGQRIFQ